MAVTINADTSNGLVMTPDTSGEIKLQSAGTDTVTVDSSGNVGIGTSSPSSLGNLVVSAVTDPVIALEDQGAWNASIKVIGASGALTFNNASNTERMRIDSSGNVGIGTSSPSSQLHIANTGNTGTSADNADIEISSTNRNSSIILNAEGSNSSSVIFQNEGTEKGRIIYNMPSNYMSFQTNGTTERMRINASGIIGIGVSGIGSVQMGMRINGQSWFCVWEDDVGNDKFRVASNGAAYNNGTWGTISDIKLKENIVDATPKLDDLMKIKVRNFNFIGEDNKHIGVIAQELEEVFPNLVQEDYDHKEIEVTKTDENGNTYTETEKVIDEENTTKRVKTSVLLHIAIKAIQEQQEIIKGLETRIQALENA